VAQDKWRTEVEQIKNSNLMIVKGLTANFESKLKVLKDQHDQELSQTIEDKNKTHQRK
jgi:hypothetical protein